MQCVQDLKVIQEPKPVQILLPIVPNEIDYPLGLEIYGKEKSIDMPRKRREFKRVQSLFENRATFREFRYRSR